MIEEGEIGSENGPSQRTKEQDDEEQGKHEHLPAIKALFDIGSLRIGLARHRQNCPV